MIILEEKSLIINIIYTNIIYLFYQYNLYKKIF